MRAGLSVLCVLVVKISMKYSVVTFGCRVNQADSLGFEEGLRAGGYVAAEPDQADVVVVNTCSVTSSADQSARQIVRRIARQNPSARIIVTGCYATRRPDELAALPQVTRVVLNDDKAQLVPLLLPCRHDGGSLRRWRGELRCADRTRRRRPDGIHAARANRMRASRVPTASFRRRGDGPVSLAIADVLKEVERVVDAGFKEIALTGVHLGSYGRDLTPPASLLSCCGVAAKSTTRSVRFPGEARGGSRTSCSASVLSSRWTARPRSSSWWRRRRRLPPLPPSAAARQRSRASRHASPIHHRAVGALVDSIRARMPGASIGSDVIVGFPGETDDDFAELAAYLDGSPLTHVHVFPYSDRPGTEASALAGKVAGTVVRERARLVRDIAQRLSARFRNGQVGTVHRGLTLEDGTLVVTGNYLKVRIAPGRGRNEWVDLRLTDVTDTIRGEILRLPHNNPSDI